MSNQNDPFRGGGAEYGGPQYQQPSMRPVGAPPAPASYPPHVDEAWGASKAPVPVQPAPAQAEDPHTVVLSRAYEAHGDEAWGASKAPVPVQPAPAQAEDPHTVVLSRAYEAHGEPIRKIKFRAPITKDIRQHGNPLKFVTGPDGRVVDAEIRYDVVAKYIPLLASPPIPPSTADQFDFFDLDACAGVIVSFFVKIR